VTQPQAPYRPEPELKPQPAPEPELKPQPVSESMPQPKPEPQPVPESRSQPKPEPQPAPEPQPKPEPQPEPTAQEKPKPKRASRRAAGIPADLVVMMNDIFGEGVTYIAETPDEDEGVMADVEDEEPTESEFAEEPVDDADYDDED